MKVLRNIKVPTGNILITKGDKGKLECLSIGDYGKETNIKASFMGLDRGIEYVEHQEMLPLEEKWVVTVSTQYGCNSGCVFCDVPKVGKGINATYEDLKGQVIECLKLHPEVESTKRLNVHFARMGEPTWNPNVIEFSKNLLKEVRPYINRSFVHPVISTMLPKKNKNLMKFLADWMEIKNYNFRGEAGLQFSINSTSDEERDVMFSGNSLSLKEISEIGKSLDFPKGRKITLNFAIAGYEIDAKKLRGLFDPEKFLVKLTPMHKTETALEHGIETDGEYTSMYPYLHHEEELKKQGFDVIVFIASEYEDMGRITCGNAILSGTNPECPYEDLVSIIN
ncbi:Fe-S-oxidoreductase [Clostridium sp.]|uniref:Fe-S-oxidoreductase n=1 Tax=Clostridium sp. TaxID=1506 RepID=UPI0029104263|nr:Fe-S-oxidoreductase [Clostridium sp.]MDU3409999.1 Fe-S-oxidoreductase [Clostridium sp.]